MGKHYFAADGSFGSADGLEIIDTADWTEEEWDIIENTTDDDRSRIAAELSK